MKKKEYTPTELYVLLQKTVIGQDDYLKKVATTVWLHNKRCEVWADRHKHPDLHLQKSNLLCVGPTGSGKTLAVTTLAKIYGFHVLVTDMSSYTGTGWHGNDVKDMIRDLYLECEGNREKTERGIIVMDELDKAILQKDARERSFAVENSLLKLIEGAEVSFEVNKRTHWIDTTNILFIGAGAFEGVEDIIKRRVNKKRPIGFLADHELKHDENTDLLPLLTRQDLMEFGAGAQLLGRFAELAVLRKLDVNDLTAILLDSEASVINSNDNTLRYACGIRVSADEAGARAVAEQAVEEETGARGLAQIIQPMINVTLYYLHVPGTYGESVNEMRLTARDGKPWFDLLKGERQKEGERLQKDKRRPFSFPKPSRGHVERFSWHVLSCYLYQNSREHSFACIEGSHLLLCSLIFFLLEECRQDDWTISSLFKLLRDKEVYDVLISDIRDKPESKSVLYYEKLQKKYFIRPAMGLLEKALKEFDKEVRFPEKKDGKKKNER